jgi:hypothetical protein
LWRTPEELLPTYFSIRFFALEKGNGFLFLIGRQPKERRNPLSEITVDLRLKFKVPEKGLTINGLIRGFKEGTAQIHQTLLTTLMEALEEKAIERWLQKDPDRYRRNGYQRKPRQLKCSLGTIRYRFAQLVDRKQGRTFRPLVEALSIPPHDQYLEEALEPSIGLVVHVSFRRATKEVERIQGQSMSHTTVHGRFQQFAQTHNPFGSLKEIPFQFLLVDGTKVHLQGHGAEDLGQVDMRWALASRGPSSRFEPVGFWIDTRWAQIRKDLNQRLNYPKLKALFSDGGPGIQENLLHPRMEPQRCLWHGKREFPYLLYADGLKKDQQAPFLQKLQSLPALNFTQYRMEQLRPEDCPLVEQISQQTQRGFQDLLNALDPEKYPRARAYIQNLMKPVTTFLSWWLKRGEIIPLNTNAIESAFSQVCNRIKKVGRRWSEKGLLNWLKITFYKIFKPELWNLQWIDNRKRLPKIRLISVQASYSWSEPIT